MNIDSIIRQLKIDMITDQDNNPILLWFNELWDKLSIIDKGIDADYLYYNKENKCLFVEFDDRFWCDYDLYWQVLYYTFNLTASQVQKITKLLIESKLNRTIPFPVYQVGLSIADVNI